MSRDEKTTRRLSSDLHPAESAEGEGSSVAATLLRVRGLLIRNGTFADWSPAGIAFDRGADVWVGNPRTGAQRRDAAYGARSLLFPLALGAYGAVLLTQTSERDPITTASAGCCFGARPLQSPSV